MTMGKRADLVTGIILIIAAVFIFREAAAMPVLKRGLGPGGYPMFSAIGLGVLGAILTVQSLLKSAGDGKLFTISGTAIGRVVFFMALTLAYIQLLRPLGFILASILFLVAGIRFFGYKRYWLSITASVAMTVLLYAVFRYVFLVLIPTGTIFQ